MLQFYALSIFLNLLGGYTLIAGDDGEALEIRPGFSLKDETVQMILGILSVATALLKLLSPVEGDIPVLGDLVSALVGFLVGAVLILNAYKNRAGAVPVDEKSATGILLRYKKLAGFAGVVAAALHFLFPQALLL